MTVEATRADLDVLRRHARHSSAFLAFNEETRHFCRPDVDGLVAYRPAGRRHLLQISEVFAAADDKAAMLAGFRAWAKEGRRKITAVQLPKSDALLYAENNFSVNQMGASYSIDLDGYALKGQRFVKTRNMISRARREGVEVTELDTAAIGAAGADLDKIDGEWLRSKGWHVKELSFMIGERGGPGSPQRRIFLARHQGEPVAYVTYSPVFGERSGWLYDLTRRRTAIPPGVIELIFFTALTAFQAEGAGWLHLGFTPFVQLDAQHEIAGAANAKVDGLLRKIRERGAFLYPAATQESFKLKWYPQLVEPEYLAFEDGFRFGALWALLRATRTI